MSCASQSRISTRCSPGISKPKWDWRTDTAKPLEMGALGVMPEEVLLQSKSLFLNEEN